MQTADGEKSKTSLISHAFPAIGRLVAQARVPYEGLSLGVASRLGGALAFVLVGLTLFLVPFEQPTAGLAGWLILIANVLVWLVVGFLLVSGSWVQSPNILLASSYVASIQIAALIWVSEGGDSLYLPLYLIPIVCVAAIHPLRRWLLFTAAVAVLALAPIVTGEHSLFFFGRVFLSLILWTGLGLVILLMMSDVRAQRRQLELDQNEASRLARLDSLTGLGNQRGFWESIQRETAHADRTYRPLSIVLADLDHFKKVNDRFGHREGDELLARVGVALARTARTSDRCFRYGGEEFAVILRDVDLSGAEVAAERFRAAVNRISSPGGPVTMSCGVAQYESNMDGDELLRAADGALMLAKRAGRDRVVRAGSEAVAEGVER